MEGEVLNPSEAGEDEDEEDVVILEVAAVIFMDENAEEGADEADKWVDTLIWRMLMCNTYRPPLTSTTCHSQTTSGTVLLMNSITS